MKNQNRSKNDLTNNKKSTKYKMLQFLIKKLTKKLWNYGPIENSEMDYEGVTIPYFKKIYRPRITEPVYGAIDWLIMTNSDDCLMIPEIIDYCHWKWTE